VRRGAGAFAAARRSGHAVARAAVALTALVVAVLAGPGGTPQGVPVPTADAAAPVQVVWWNYFTESMGLPVTRELIAEFNAQNPRIQVEQQYHDFPKMSADVQAAIAAGQPPDVAQVTYDQVAIASTLPHKTIAQLATPDEMRVLQRGLYPIFLKSSTYGGTLQLVPHAIGAVILYINADLFRQAGLDPNRPPATWAELRADAQQLKQKTGKFGVFIIRSSSFGAAELIASAGGRMIGPNGRPAFAGAPGLEAMTYWQNLVHDGLCPNIGDAEGLQAFAGGQIGMYVSTSAQIAGITKQASFDVRTSKIPIFPGRGNYGTHTGSGLMVFAQDPQRASAAWKFVQFLLSPSSVTKWVQGTGYLPVKQGLADNPTYLGVWYAKHPLYKPAVQELPALTGVESWPGTNGVQINRIISDARDAILAGAPVKQTLDQTVTQVEALLPKGQ